MPVWAYWLIFFVVGAFAIFFAKRLDDDERLRWSRRASPPESKKKTAGQT